MDVNALVRECGSQRSTLCIFPRFLSIFFLIQNHSLNPRLMGLFRFVASERRGPASLLNPRAGHLDMCHPAWLFFLHGF